MHICHLFTRTLSIDASSGGQFDANVSIPDEMFLAAPDKLALVKHTIAMHLASHIFDTEVPAEYWYARYPKVLQQAFDFPEVMQMKV